MNPAAIDRISPQLRALHAKSILEATLRRGFTTVRDAAGGDVSLSRALHLGLIDGPRLFYPGLALSQTGGHGDARPPDHFGMCSCAYCGALSIVVDGPDEMRKAVREQLRQGATQIKLFVSGGVLSPSDPFWMNQFSDEEIRVAVAEAATRRTYVMAHAHTNEATLRCLANGVRSIEHATSIEADGARAIADHDAFAVPTLSIITAIKMLGPRLGIPAVMLEKAEQVGEDALRSLELLRKAGARVGFGTDLLGPAMDMQLQEFRLRKEVYPTIDILRSATSVNAALLQMEGLLGRMAVGAHADILAVDGNPLEDLSIMERPERFCMIMRAGKIIELRSR
jgi:imidazolonepropionase-like amidohydrolase